MSSEKKKRSKLKIAIIIIVSILVLLLVGMQVMIFLVYNQSFGRRYSDSSNLGLFRREDYTNMTYTGVEFPSNKGQILRGFIYEPATKADYKGVVVFNHGFGGGGHDSYLPIIDYLTQNQYTVLGFDKTGNDLSDGESVKGFEQGVIDLEYALDFVRSDSRLNQLPIMLLGHSWGGYSVCSVLEKEKDIAATVSLAGCNSIMELLVEQGSDMVGFDVQIFSPFFVVCSFVNFGFDSGFSSVKGLAATDTPVMVVHSMDDDMVSAENSFKMYQEKLGDKPNLTFVEMNNAGHDVYYAADTIAYNRERYEYSQNIKKDNPDMPQEQLAAALMDGFDKPRANALNMDLMNQIVTFFDNAIADAK